MTTEQFPIQAEDGAEHSSVRRHQGSPGLRRIAVPVAALLAVGATGCGSNDSEEDATASSNEVTIRLIAFKPDTLAIKAGATVSWVQRDAATHTVTSGTVEPAAAAVTEMPDGMFASGELATGKRFEFTFDQRGTYPYFCEIHPATMRGQVSVR